MSSKIIFVFLDGVGLGNSDEYNPFWIASMPNLYNLLGGPLVKGFLVDELNILLQDLDACLGIDGLPQSATGQTTLFTGVNAAKELGYHLAAYPNNQLIRIINKQNIFKDTIELGCRATFANAYHFERYNQLIQSKSISHAATTICAMSAQMPLRGLRDLQDGRAVYWDITNEFLSVYDRSIKIVTPEIAGERLVGLSQYYDLVLFECFMTDILGHRGKIFDTLSFIAILDRFLSGIFTHMDDDTTLVISSDHGNIEDTSVGYHTYNSVPLLVIGRDTGAFKGIQSITELKDCILCALSG